MKKLFLTMALAGLFGLTANAQFFAPDYRLQPALSIPSGGYLIGKATMTTNIASPPACAVRGDFLALYMMVGATNQTLSNLYVRVQLSADGTDWFGALPSATGTGILTNDTSVYQETFIPMDKIGANYTWTNILSSTTAPGIRWARIHSVSNSAFAGGVLSNNVWITNMWFITQ